MWVEIPDESLSTLGAWQLEPKREVYKDKQGEMKPLYLRTLHKTTPLR